MELVDFMHESEEVQIKELRKVFGNDLVHIMNGPVDHMGETDEYSPITAISRKCHDGETLQHMYDWHNNSSSGTKLAFYPTDRWATPDYPFNVDVIRYAIVEKGTHY
jgi:hypothetical protein